MARLDSTSGIRLSDDSVRRDIPSFIEARPPVVSHPFLRPRPHKAMNLMSAFEESSEPDDSELVQVYLRLRPCKKPSPLYEVVSDKKLVTLTDTTTAGHGRKTQHNIAKVYAFSNIFSADTSQKEIFEKVVKDNLNKLPDGQSYNLMTYGASGSGKTYTLMGTVTSPGLVPRSLEYLFKIIDAAQQPLYKPTDYGDVHKLTLHEQDTELNVVKSFSQMSAPLRNKYRRMSVTLNKNLTTSSFDLSSRKRHYVWVSFVEIYNESLYDLLQTTDRNSAASKLRIREDPKTGLVYAKGLTQAFVRSGEEAYDVMVAGKHNLQVAATGVHARSSRSHCIFTITLITETECGIRTSYVRLCDLAGCERAGRTHNTGARMAESRAINTSLHVLQRCLHALRHKKHDAVVPYRESKLTRLLGAGLSGGRGEAVSMVMTVNPDVTFVQESRPVLLLAAVVSDIQLNQTYMPSMVEHTMTTMTTTFDGDSLDTDYSVLAQENMRLRATVERLHFELEQRESEIHRLSRLVEEKNVFINECVEEAKAMTSKYYEGRIKVAEKRHARELDELKEELESYKRRFNNDTSSLQETNQDDTSELNKSDDEDIDKDNRETLQDDDEKSSSEEDNAIEDQEDVSSKRDSLVLLIESDSEDELNQSLEPRFKIKDKMDNRNIKNISKQALVEDEQESSDESDDESVESNKISNDNTRSGTKDDMEGDFIDSLWKEFSRESIGNDNQSVNYVKDVTMDSSKESAIDKTPVDFEDNFVKAVENKESTEGYESCTENDVNAEITNNFAQRKAYPVDVVPAEVENAEAIFKIPDKRGTFVVKDKSRLGILNLNDRPQIKRKTDSLALFEQFEEDLNIQFKNKTETKIRSNSILDFAKLKITAANIFEQKTKVSTAGCKASEENYVSKENDDINKTKSIIEYAETPDIPHKSKTYFDYPKDTPANQLEMVTLNLNSEQCTEFFREQEAKTKNDNMPKSDEHNPINEITFTKEVTSKTKTATNSKNSIDIFDEIPASPLKINKDKTQECFNKEKNLTDLAKDITNVFAKFSQLSTKLSPNKESESVPLSTGNNRDKIDEEVNKNDPKPYKMMNESNIFAKSIISSPSQLDKNNTKENIYNITQTSASPYNEQELTKNIKSNLVSLDRQYSEVDNNIEVNKACKETDQDKQKGLDLVTKNDTKISVTTAAASEKEKKTANDDKKTSKFELPKLCNTISLDFDMIADNIESKSSEFDKLAKNVNATTSEFERLVEKDDMKARNEQIHGKDGQSSIIASNESKDKTTTEKQSENEVIVTKSNKKASKFEIPQMCNTISLDFDMLAENIETRPSEFEQLAKNIDTRASEFDKLAENIDAKATVLDNVAKVADVPNKTSEKEIYKQTEIINDCKTVEPPKKVTITKVLDEIVNKHDTKASEPNPVTKTKTRATEFTKMVDACDVKVTHEAPKHIETGSLEFERIAQNIDSRPSEFEKLAENIDTRPSDFEKLAENIESKSNKVDKLAKSGDKKSIEFESLAKQFETRPSEFESLVELKKKDETEKQTQNDGEKAAKLRYNLRHKIDQENVEITIDMDHVFTDINIQRLVSKTAFQNDPKYNLRILHATDENEPASTTKRKRNLRLRKQKTTEVDAQKTKEVDAQKTKEVDAQKTKEVDAQKTKETDKIETQKLKDIVNLRHEFADVIMGGKAPEKSVQKSPSPEIKSGEENMPVDACQSVPRSRRKLYTPRTELLEESTNEEGVVVSGERIKIPRPSYQKTRTRRRLN